MTQVDVKRPSIRQAHAERTKSAILKAALKVFATRGYAEAGVREIAAEAGAHPALISRYFGSKLELFEAALAESMRVTFFTDAGRERFGENVVRALFDARDDQANPVPMIVFAGGDAAARAVVLRILQQRSLEPLARWFGEPEAEERAAQLMVVMTGFFTFAVALPLEPIANPSPTMRAWLARTLQEIVDRA